MKTAWLALCVLFPASAMADAVADLAQALQRLQGHSSYAWETTITPANVSTWRSSISYSDPDAKSGIRTDVKQVPAPIEGVTEPRLGTVTWAWLNRTDGPGVNDQRRQLRVILVHGRGVAEMQEGWMDSNEIEKEIRALLPASANTGKSIPLLNSYALQTARLQLSLQAPADELSALLADARPAMQANRAVVATLSESTAKKFVFDLRYRDGIAAAEAMPGSAEGRVTVWLKNGEIEKYEVTIDADIQQAHEHRIHFVKATSLGKFDKALVDIPAQAIAKLNAAEDAPPAAGP